MKEQTYKNKLTTTPCPFCGCGSLSTIFNEGEDGSDGFMVEVFVRCNECKSQGPIIYVQNKGSITSFDTEIVEESIRVWNERHTADNFKGFAFTEDMIPDDIKELIKKFKAKPTEKKPSPVDELKDRISEGAEMLKEVTNEKIDSIKDSISDRLQNLATKLKK